MSRVEREPGPATVLVDIGNTRIKWALAAPAGALGSSGSVPHGEAPETAATALLAALPDRLERALVANVAGAEIGRRVVEALAARFALEPETVVTRAAQLGVRCAYADPSRLGVDRWLALLAAHAEVEGAACVIQAGTAVTFDALDASGRHLGGLIFAGPRLSAEALERNTRAIGPTPVAAARPTGLGVLGRSTADAVGYAAWLGLAGGLDRAIGLVAAAAGATPVVLVTGGDAARLVPWLETRARISADLVLKGLRLLAESESDGDGDGDGEGDA